MINKDYEQSLINVPKCDKVFTFKHETRSQTHIDDHEF